MTQSNESQPDTIRLVLVTRLRLDGDALAALFQARADFHVFCTTTSTMVASVVGRHRRPDAVLLDGMLLDHAVEENIDNLIQQLGNVPILLLDDDLNNGRLAAVLGARNVGYFTRSTPFPDLAEGIRRLVKGERAFDQVASSLIHNTPHGWRMRRDHPRTHLAMLTPREIEVLKLIAQGHSVKHCAALLKLAPSTVDNHKARLMKKLGVHKSLDLTRLAIREGLVHA